jgi:4-diphosphocytidyl-2-C-methyl-D-erythritol kinase
MIRLKAFAKLNLSLDIRGRRPDGYHELDTIMQSIDLYDAVLIRKSDAIKVSFDAGDIDLRRNTALSAAEAFFSFTGISGGADISVQKRIPAQSGLGGSQAAWPGSTRLAATSTGRASIARTTNQPADAGGARSACRRIRSRDSDTGSSRARPGRRRPAW